MFEHASLSYPSWLLLPFELLLVALVVLLLWRAPRWSTRWAQRLWRPVEALAEQPLRAALFVAGTALVLEAASFAAVGWPVPRFGDEHAYLLQAETFAAGRLTNPPLAPTDAFACPHVVPEPTRQSKYPPGQALLLAVGEVLGHPALGVALGVALLGVSTLWMLGAFTSAPWAVAGALLVVLRLGVGGYWGQSYWGGAVAAIGGLLLVGGLARLAFSARTAPAVAAVAGVGAALLLATRPFEGLAVGAVTLAWWLVGRAPRRRPTLTELAVSALPVAGAVAALLVYHQAVAGAPWTLPHRLYSATVSPQPHFVWEVGPTPEVLGNILRKAALTVYFQLGLVLLVPLLLATLGARGLWRRPGARLGAAVAVATLAAHAVVLPYHPHYAAPGTVGFVLLGLLALESLGARVEVDARSEVDSKSRFARAAPALTVSVLTVSALKVSALKVSVLTVALVQAVVQLPAQRPDAASDAQRRLEFQAQLGDVPGRHLVFAEPGDFWSCNGAGGLEQPVLWARAMGPEADACLASRWPSRRAWTVTRGADGVVQLEPRTEGVSCPATPGIRDSNTTPGRAE